MSQENPEQKTTAQRKQEAPMTVEQATDPRQYQEWLENHPDTE